MREFSLLVSQLLQEILFHILHIIMNIVISVQTKYKHFCIRRVPIGQVKKNDIILILEHVNKWQKRPNNLVIVVDTNYHCGNDLARIVIWSLVAGVPFLSFYDVTGSLKQNENKLYNEVKKHVQELPGCIRWTNKPNLNGHIDAATYKSVDLNMFSSGVTFERTHDSGLSVQEINNLSLDYPSITIHIFTSDDGRPKIAHCIGQIAEERARMPQNKEITVEELNTRLNAIYPLFPDPDVAFYTGPTCRTCGFLPWQISLTEFVQLSVDHSIDVHGYLQAMYKYNRCHQRFGR